MNSERKPTPPEGGKDAYTRERLHQIGTAIDDQIPAGWGFFLMVFPFHDAPGRMNYISNADRKDVHNLMREFLAKGGARFEHR